MTDRLTPTLYPVTIGEITFQAAPLPIEMRELSALGATIGCAVNAIARRQHAPINFGHTLENQPEFFTFWSDEIAAAEWRRMSWFRRHLYQFRFFARHLREVRGGARLLAKIALFLQPAPADPLAASQALLDEALTSMDSTKLQALLQPHPPSNG